VVQPFADAKKYLQFHRDFVRTMPDEMTVWTVIRKAPPLPFLPADVHGKLVVIVPFLYVGDPKKGEELIKPLRDFGNVSLAPLSEVFRIRWKRGSNAFLKLGKLLDQVPIATLRFVTHVFATFSAALDAPAV
jgi:hypothetical protein